MKEECPSKHHHGRGHGGRGPSSAWLHEPKMVLEHLPLKPGQVFVDLGCGSGDYAIEAAKAVGARGRVYAVDKWPYLIDHLAKTAKTLGLENITPLLADIIGMLPIEDRRADMVFIATVLHIFNLQKNGPAIFSEVSRILKPEGCLAIVECKKENQAFGPPIQQRNAPEEIIAAVAPQGFEKASYHDLGYNYLIQFTNHPGRRTP